MGINAGFISNPSNNDLRTGVLKAAGFLGSDMATGFRAEI